MYIQKIKGIEGNPLMLWRPYKNSPFYSAKDAYPFGSATSGPPVMATSITNRALAIFPSQAAADQYRVALGELWKWHDVLFFPVQGIGVVR